MNRLNGAELRLTSGHCDPTVNLYDWHVCVRSDRIEQLWPGATERGIWRTDCNTRGLATCD
jgi:hypothetical protein